METTTDTERATRGLTGLRDAAATGTAFSHVECRACGEQYGHSVTPGACHSCGGVLDPRYEYEEVGVGPEDWERRGGSMWAYRELLPVRDPGAIVSMGEGQTPLVACPRLAEGLDVGGLWLKDEGQNPTNTFKDRGQSAAVSAANEHGIETVALASAGNAGHAASAYAARAGMDCHVFLNHQAGSVKKGMVRVHGAQLHLCDGKLGDAGQAFREARAEHGWYSVATFETPFRHEGKKTMGYELFEAFDWTTPDHIVYPTGGGVGLIGIWKAYRELRELGWLTGEPPALHVVQTTGAAPVVKAIERGDDEHEPWTDPDSIARGVEVTDPGASPWMLEAVDRSGGTGVAVSDEAAFDAALAVARRGGPEMCVTSAVAFAGTQALAERGVFGPEESVVVINTGAGCKTADYLRNVAREH